MAREVVVNCDIHGTPGANEWVFESGSRRWCMDLCPEICEKLLAHEFIGNAQEQEARPTPASGVPPVTGRKYRRMVRGLPAPPQELG